VQDLRHAAAGQIRIAANCLAKYELLDLPNKEWAPIYGIEFFPEAKPTGGLALTLLTPVEQDVCERLRTGKTNRQIAEARGTSPATVKNQVSTILQKLQMERRTELIAAQPYRGQFPDAPVSISSGGTLRTR
jgi:DNA-binding NarL/FixJ family response regulator